MGPLLLVQGVQLAPQLSPHGPLEEIIDDKVHHADVDHGEAGLEERGHCLQGAGLGNGRIQSLYSTHLREWYIQ